MSIKGKVVVAMSGGVDSSVAAALLKEQGHDVIGVTMQIWPNSSGSNSCCSLSAVEDARRVANKLGIPYYVVNFNKIFKKTVIDDFISQYNNGRTPNPCVRCNQYIKFDALLKKAQELGADRIATGHYARIWENRSGRYVLKKGIDPKKDQSYFLYPLSQEALSRTVFPLGDLTKVEVRKLAKKFSLNVADKEESQEICFVDGSFGDLFALKEGNIVDLKGNVLGAHKGYQLYTVGQRRGLRLSRPKPAYVVKIDPNMNEITVGEEGDVYGDELIAGHLNLVSLADISSPMKVKARIRYNAKDTDADIYPLSREKVKVTFNRPQFAITPGQSVVFYEEDEVIGGGIIEKGKSLPAGRQG